MQRLKTSAALTALALALLGGCASAWQRGASARHREFDEAIELSRRGDARGAIDRLRPLAERGDGRAQFCLGVILGRGDAGTAKENEARAWLERAAGQDHGLAQYYLGVMYEKGWGIPSDPAEALRWYVRSAATGEAAGEYGVATCHYYGIGAPRNVEAAVTWYRRAADHGEPNAQHTLGWMYLTGTGVRKDEREAASLFAKAAAQGNPRAQFNLGYVHLLGQGVARSAEQAYLWFAIAKGSYPASNEVQRQRCQQGMDRAGVDLPESDRARLLAEAERRRPRARVRDCTTAVIYPSPSTNADNPLERP